MLGGNDGVKPIDNTQLKKKIDKKEQRKKSEVDEQ
jgi:hypothetical protein